MLLISYFDRGQDTSHMSTSPCYVTKFEDNKIITNNYAYLTYNPTNLYNVLSIQYTYETSWSLTALVNLKYYDGQSKKEATLSKGNIINWNWNDKRDLLFYL